MVLCDWRDVGGHAESLHKGVEAPVIFIFDYCEGTGQPCRCLFPRASSPCFLLPRPLPTRLSLLPNWLDTHGCLCLSCLHLVSRSISTPLPLMMLLQAGLVLRPR